MLVVSLVLALVFSQAAPPVKRSRLTGATLQLECGLLMQSGDVKRCARVPFALLDADVLPELNKIFFPKSQ